MRRERGGGGGQEASSRLGKLHVPHVAKFGIEDSYNSNKIMILINYTR